MRECLTFLFDLPGMSRFLQILVNYCCSSVGPKLTVRTAKVDNLPTKWTQFDWWTEYSAKNETEVDALWDSILPSHGLIAVDGQWASERQWPDSLPLPGDESKKIYLLEAYHLLHCVVRSLSLEFSTILNSIENHP